MPEKVLILGGTGDARALAAELHDAGTDVTSSLAGRVADPNLPPGRTRIGGFGGPDGLARYLTEHRIDRVIDATHPFATRISENAISACAAARVPLQRLERPGFDAHPDDTWVDTLAEAAAHCRGRVLLTTGRQGIAAFRDTDAWLLIRCITAPDGPLPRHRALLLQRGPFTLEHERALLRHHRIDMLITKDSGGPAPKLDAARERGLPIVMVRRPA